MLPDEIRNNAVIRKAEEYMELKSELLRKQRKHELLCGRSVIRAHRALLLYAIEQKLYAIEQNSKRGHQ